MKKRTKLKKQSHNIRTYKERYKIGCRVASVMRIKITSLADQNGATEKYIDELRGENMNLNKYVDMLITENESLKATTIKTPFWKKVFG